MTAASIDCSRSRALLWWCLLAVGSLLLGQVAPVAGDEQGVKSPGVENEKGWLGKVSADFSGNLRTSGTASWVDSASYLAVDKNKPQYDLSGELRLKNRLSFGRDLVLTTHYQVNASHGDLLETTQELQKNEPILGQSGLAPGFIQEDQTAFFDLSSAFHQEERSLAFHRVDRLYLSLVKPWGTLSLGRQALTWGNGLVFHPFDLFNPFAPSAIIKDYKTGQDLVSLLVPVGTSAELDLLYVPRREGRNRQLRFDASSLAGKLHCFAADYEFDLLAARHYRDSVLGLGGRGYLESAAWRWDMTWTLPDKGDGYLSLVANLDRSWVWKDTNFYGFVEAYYSGLGLDDPGKLLDKPTLLTRINRGELFVLGRTYLALGAEVELHPLLLAGTNLILHTGDGSGLLQPKLTWDLASDLEVIIGASLYFGGDKTEFGGFALSTPTREVPVHRPNALFAWLTWYF